MTVCKECGGTVIEYDAAAGNGFCVQCGTVIEENTIVSEVTFGEAASGAAIVQGSFVGQGSTRARMSGPFGTRGAHESREQTIENASKKIRNVAAVLRLSEVVQTAAIRMYTLALEHKFTKGRKNMNVIAVCLYVACRQKETRNYMLIDFSDLLQVNVFELGHTYLQLVQTLHLKLPLVDPSHYISRFAALLEFGDEAPRVAADAVRLASRFDRDWMSRGRRPAGICGACLLLAARMNNFRRSVQEVVQVVKIADSTLKKRLEEFRNTPSGRLTLADFRTVWLEEECDPPAFVKGRQKETKEKERETKPLIAGLTPTSGESAEMRETKGRKKKRRGKRPAVDRDRETKAVRGAPEEAVESVEQYQYSRQRKPIDPQILNQGILAGTSTPLAAISECDQSELPPSQPLFLPEVIDPALRSPLPHPSSLVPVHEPTIAPSQDQEGAAALSFAAETMLSTTETKKADNSEALTDPALEAEVASFLSNTQGAALSAALDEAEAEARRRRAEATALMSRTRFNGAASGSGDAETGGTANGAGGRGVEGQGDALEDLDDEELDAFILSEDEVRIKERVWVEMNREYLEALALKEAQKEGSAPVVKSRKRRKAATPHAPSKPRDASTASGRTAAESVHNLIQRSARYSRRINYDALKSLFDMDSTIADAEMKMETENGEARRSVGVAAEGGREGWGERKEGTRRGNGGVGETREAMPGSGVRFESPGSIDLSEKEEEMYTIPPEPEGEVEMKEDDIVEESGGGVSMDAGTVTAEVDGEDMDAEGEEDGEAIGGYDYGWEEGYEQEV